MAESYVLSGVIVVLVLLAAFGSVYFVRFRRTSDHIKKAAYMTESRVYRAMADKFGVAPNLVHECATPEGESIIDAMTRCDRCGAVEDCHHFFEAPDGDVDEARNFCPNADLFIDMADKLHRGEDGAKPV